MSDEAAGPEFEHFPLRVAGEVIGALAVSGPPETHVRRAAELLAATAADFCSKEVELRRRVSEIQALAQLSSHLARAANVDAVLNTALQSALDLMQLDAGSVVLYDEDHPPSPDTEEDLVLKASRNLSREWLESPLPASKGRLFDRLALAGELVTSEDLLADDRVLIPDMVRREGLRSFINCALLFQDRPIGVLRLYSRRPRRFTDAERRLVRSITQQAAVAVEQARLLKVQDQDARLQRQLQLAADVQRRMLPRRVPQPARLDIAARYEPSYELGGDFYDLFELGASLGVTIGDVVGKGMAAALLMSSVRSSLRAHVQDLYHIEDVVARVNAALCRDTRDNEFATLWYGVIEPASLRMTYCAAGHEPPFIVRRSSGTGGPSAAIIELSSGGMPVGIDPQQKYEHVSTLLQPGDVVVAYTDGMTDAVNFDSKRFGKKRLRDAALAAVRDNPSATATQVIERLFWEIRQFAGVMPRPDDQTVVVVRVR
ncbi:MAG: SpoIIE family protein phosphatase [Phycisphaerales bacterium]|nr:SpoIIE family protein phosphatase [Phycisphaerales bacterium]